jgi:hypothetical protein
VDSGQKVYARLLSDSLSVEYRDARISAKADELRDLGYDLLIVRNAHPKLIVRSTLADKAVLHVNDHKRRVDAVTVENHGVLNPVRFIKM